jgi:hypothetical protein
LYGGGEINVTAEALEKINRNKEDLKRFRCELHGLKDNVIRKHVKRELANRMRVKNNHVRNIVARAV